ncbi:probable peroxisomal acyl-coenzyme A oxidase 1 [Eupeodes corollae]|uniref:probable peroxisomal acyl-coenzyme A oxidase 1 n=1 Tax=Eupeodes corollae TaxID=290404 RepID=UPI002491DA4D|nr:probable peroxisomal acyl-coenzyme A oxidase 1 [Eupeodes corollae]XP_055916134.1 probable peroxisomal acyl-coenzyme A oxidase 1 [Eupeodes corollae]XP_055916135.1 probable peroxisomal acyl-coenzyme A oxidase 1 [Eupeodes corollae]
MPMPTKSTKVNPDLVKERQAATFNVEEFASWLYGGEQKLKVKREIVEEIVNDKELQFEEVYPDYLSFQDQYNDAVKRSTLLLKKLKAIQEKRNPGGNEIYPDFLTGPVGNAIIPQGSPFAVHFRMFIPVIEKHGTSEQLEKWLPLAKSCKILGSYAQTEMGHGTFIRGIQTRADYDPATEEFVLNSTSITAYKWWPGALGHTVNYATIVAQLYIKDKRHGVHFFIVQLRDHETHEPLPGIDIGEIGNKLSFKGVNNGYLGLKNVRIPRMQMLMRHAQVSADGSFTVSPASVLTYWTMVYVRVLLVKQSSMFLSQAAVIATRYAAVRRQSLINPKEPEHQILDYLTQQQKLFVEISKSIAINLGGDLLNEMYLQVTNEINEGKFDRLAEIHCLSACLKAISTHDSSNGVETLRLACGGHGFMAASNLANIYGLATAAVTYEGENTVMLLQTARFLMKSWSMAVEGEKLVPTVAYLEEVASGKTRTFPKWDGSLECMVKALQFAAANKIRLAYNHSSERKMKNLTAAEAANATSIELTQAADLHGRSFLATATWKKLSSEDQISSSLKTVLLDILELYLVSACFRNLSDLQRFIELTEEDLNRLQIKLEQVLSRLRPNAVAIVDGFDFHDRILNSVLGCYDGNVYERIFEAAQKSPMNQISVQKSFQSHLKPFMKSNM